MTRMLITGGAGFIGSRLAHALAIDGHEVTVLDCLSEQVHGPDPQVPALLASAGGRIRFLRGSVCDEAALLAAIEGNQCIVHLAAETGTGQSMYMVEHYTAVNIQATSKLLDLLGRHSHDVRRLVVASSRSIYGEGKYLQADGTAVFPPHRSAADLDAGRFELYDPQSAAPLQLAATDEASRLHPSSVYGITKLVQEQLVMTVCPLIGIEPVALRYQNVYGPGQSLNNPYTGILSIFSNLIMQGRAIDVFEDGLESRDFVYVDDVVAATVLATRHAAAAGQIFNVGSGVAVSVLRVVEELAAAFACAVDRSVSGNYRLGDIRHNYADLGKISRMLGFEPKVGFSQGIRNFVDWARQSGPQASDYEGSLGELKDRGLLKRAQRDRG